MQDCYFGLLRYYLRVDNVIVRIIDTRIFHSFEDGYILREFSVRENSYEELIKKGFKFGSEFSLAPGQSDQIYKYLDVIYINKDKIILN
jgi:type 2A phosphatase activator TIP41